MKNVLFVSMIMLASLLFAAPGASAQYCSSFLPSCHWQETLGMRAQELSAATSQGGGEFLLTAPATQEGIGEMIPADARPVTWEMNFKEHTAQFTNSRELCGYCSVYERAGFP